MATEDPPNWTVRVSCHRCGETFRAVQWPPVVMWRFMKHWWMTYTLPARVWRWIRG